MAKVSNPYPTGIQPKRGKKPKENNCVSNVSNYNHGIGWRGGKKQKEGGEITEIGPIGLNRGELDTLDTPHPVRGSKLVPVNDLGYRVGEGHYKARLTDADVDAIREEYEAGMEGRGPRIGYRLLAKKWSVGKRTIRDIVHYDRRNQWAANWKRIK